MKTYAIIPAGGKGKRSGSATPKQYLKFNGKELIAYTLSIFQQDKFIDELIIAAEEEYHPLLKKITEEQALTKISKLVLSGDERQDSVYNSLKESGAADDDLIVVHDAARPLLPASVLSNAILTARQKGNAVVCIKAKDTLIKAKKAITTYLNRDEVFYVQTPQIFNAKDLGDAMENARKKNIKGTDESMLVRKLGIEVNIVEGSVFNFKVTTEEDLKMFKILSEKHLD